MQPWYVQLGLFPLIGIPYAIMMHAAPVQWCVYIVYIYKCTCESTIELVQTPADTNTPNQTNNNNKKQ